MPKPAPPAAPAPPSAVALHDARSFFEKALQHGLQHGILSPGRLAAINADAPKGMVQIARYFGSEFLRPELEKARERIVNLVSLKLLQDSGGDLQQAAQALREHSLLSRSKGGSDLLKALIVMPASSHFGMIERGEFADRHIPQLAEWSLRSWADYQAELARRSASAQAIEAARWMAESMGLDADELHDAACDAEAVIRTSLLIRLAGGHEMPDWVTFEKCVLALRRQHGEPLLAKKATVGKTASSSNRKAGKTVGGPPEIPLPRDLPASMRPLVETVRVSVAADWSRMIDSNLPPRKLFGTPAFMGRYFWIEDALHEVDHHDRTASSAWQALTRGHTDDGSLLTLLLCVAAGSVPMTLLKEAAAKTLIRRIRKSGIQSDTAAQWLQDHAPVQDLDDYLSLWQSFVEEALPTLTTDRDPSLNDALALLRRECNVV